MKTNKKSILVTIFITAIISFNLINTSMAVHDAGLKGEGACIKGAIHFGAC
jgi:hypothetical protein